MLANTQTYDVSDVARWTGYSTQTVRRWADKGALPCSKSPAGTRRFDGAKMHEWLHDHGFEIPTELQPTAEPQLEEPNSKTKTSRAA